MGDRDREGFFVDSIKMVGRTLFWTDRSSSVLWTSDCTEEDGVGIFGGVESFVCKRVLVGVY